MYICMGFRAKTVLYQLQNRKHNDKAVRRNNLTMLRISTVKSYLDDRHFQVVYSATSSPLFQLNPGYLREAYYAHCCIYCILLTCQLIIIQWLLRMLMTQLYQLCIQIQQKHHRFYRKGSTTFSTALKSGTSKLMKRNLCILL